MLSLHHNLLAVTATVLALGKYVLAGAPESCPTTLPLSCHNTSAVANTCCFASPGGLLLQTQFWDAGEPYQGPSTSWTVHGLWPDYCDGTYPANCDPSRAYTNITQILQAYKATSLLSYMQTYWTDDEGDDETFWEHEWAKHGTCISTFDTDCYTKYTPQEEVVDFFNDTVNLYKTLPTYTWLSNAGIVPSSSKTYTSAAVLKALNTPRGVNPYISCSNGALDEVWYYFYLQGSVQTGKFEATDASAGGTVNNCPATLTYLPKTSTSTPPTTSTTKTTSKTTTTSTKATTTTKAASTTIKSTSTTKTTSTTTKSSTATPTAFIGKGYANVQTSGSTNGCLISAGTWYTTGTCATYTGTLSGTTGVTLTSSKGACAIVSGVFTCASSVGTPAVFAVDGNLLAYAGQTDFYAAEVPTGTEQVDVEVGVESVVLQIVWEAT